MLKNLFTSKARIKLLSAFLLHPDEEHFVRELTRSLDEQINSVRRELDNLKQMGLLRSRVKNRRKFYAVNKNFILYRELRNIVIKASTTSEQLIKSLQKLGAIDFLLLSGLFMDKDSQVDLLMVGKVDKEKVERFLDSLETERPIRFSILSQSDFEYRIKCRDKFILDLIEDSDNLIAINKFDKIFE